MYNRAFCIRLACWKTWPGDFPAKAASSRRCIYLPPFSRETACGKGSGFTLFLFFGGKVFGWLAFTGSESAGVFV